MTTLRRTIVIIMTASAITPAVADVEAFDAPKSATVRADWTAGVTGKGSPVWRIEPDPSAPSKPNVLKQSGSGTFPWYAKKSASISNGFVEVKFKALSGREDQAGGVIWRFKDGDNYYVARANALENNVSLYYMAKGRRVTLKYVDAPVALGQWHTLRVAFEGRSIKVGLNGKQYIAVDDDHISGAGAVGVWTKADSVTAFDDFSYGGR